LHTDNGNLWVKGSRGGWEQFFSKDMLIVLKEICELRNMSVAGYVWEVVDADIAQFRLQRIAPHFLQARGAAPANPRNQSKCETANN